jgi:hypothetical protein
MSSESWFCPSCGAGFTGHPPWHRLCRACLGLLESLGYEPDPGARHGDLPPCPDCDGQMVEVVPIVRPPDPERAWGDRERQ